VVINVPAASAFRPSIALGYMVHIPTRKVATVGVDRKPRMGRVIRVVFILDLVYLILLVVQVWVQVVAVANDLITAKALRFLYVFSNRQCVMHQQVNGTSLLGPNNYPGHGQPRRGSLDAITRPEYQSLSCSRLTECSTECLTALPQDPIPMNLVE
jgi:hypothetical protein